MSTMQSVARALLDETDPDARFALSRQLAAMVLRLLCPPDDDDTARLDTDVRSQPALPEPDEDQVPF